MDGISQDKHLLVETFRHLGTACPLFFQQLLLCATQSLFSCDAALASSPTISTTQSVVPGSPHHSITAPSSPATSSLLDHCKANPPTYVFVQGWQLLALAVSLFVPKNTKLLWFLKLHLKRNIDNKYVTVCWYPVIAARLLYLFCLQEENYLLLRRILFAIRILTFHEVYFIFVYLLNRNVLCS